MLFRSDEALATYQAILQGSPKEANAYLGVAGIQLQRQDYRAATQTYEGLLSINPGNFQALIGLSNLAMQQKNYDQALDYLNQGMKANPRQDSLYVKAASLYSLLGKPDVARQNLQKALALKPDNEEANYQMGYIL